ncbi:MAG: HIT family protein [Solirubrobacterales bacterium]|nr:HIT family protein [Solirubrobacterales bacterium]
MVTHRAASIAAPRRAYVDSGPVVTDSNCIFCKIIAGELPSARIAEDDRTIAFMDINPASLGHALVIPRSHTTDLHSIDSGDLAAVTASAQRLAGLAVERLGADGVNLLNCAGADAWQTVFHFHMHVIPRFAGQPEKDGLTLPWDPKPGDPDRIAQAAAALRGETA